MPDNPPPAPRRAIGHAIRRDDAGRERAAQVSMADVLVAIDRYHRWAAPGWQGVIEAKPEGPERG